MSIPGFSAEYSIYISKSHYSTTGMLAPVDGSIVHEMSSTLEDLMSSQLAECGKACDKESAPEIHRSAWSGPLVTPMSDPGHLSTLHDDCDKCIKDCLVSLGTCSALAGGACGASFAVPFVGLALGLACEFAAAAACNEIHVSCVNTCRDVGGKCCPVQCGAPGTKCCHYGETCLDSDKGLCCYQGMEHCYGGPQALCYDPKTEKCMPNGEACSSKYVCGDTCCPPEKGHCCGSICAPLFSTCCNGILCELGQSCHQQTHKCCWKPCGSICCDQDQTCCGSKCCEKNQHCVNGTCVACPAGQFSCNISGAPECCPEGYTCCTGSGTGSQNGECCSPDQCCGIHGGGCFPKGSLYCVPW